MSSTNTLALRAHHSDAAPNNFTTQANGTNAQTFHSNGLSNQHTAGMSRPVIRPAGARVPNTSSPTDFPPLAGGNGKATREWLASQPEIKPPPLFTQKMIAEKKARKEATLAAHNRAAALPEPFPPVPVQAVEVPPPSSPPRCNSIICPVSNWHDAKDYASGDQELPTIVKEKIGRIAVAPASHGRLGWRKLQGIPPAYWPTNDFLDLFFSCHGTVFVPSPPKREKRARESEDINNGTSALDGKPSTGE